jgi:hypothetical protein
MSLYSLDEIPQPAIGRQQHWDLFRAMQGSPLCEAIVAELQPYLDERAVDSTVVGSKVLAAIERREPQLLQALDQDEVGGLFGMVLWNHPVGRPEPSYFYPKATSGEEHGGTMYFRKK